MTTMRAIETKYRNVRFRSRTEARWAVFLDALGIRWEYEPEAFSLSSGDAYLPDFLLPEFFGGVFMEVKPQLLDRYEADILSAFEKSISFATKYHQDIWLCDGIPDFRVTHLYCGSWEEEAIAAGAEPRIVPVIPLADQAQNENRFFTYPGYEDERGYFDPDFAGDKYERAVAAVRNHRFWEPKRA